MPSILNHVQYLKQYVPQIVDIFRSWWSNYKDNSRKFDRGEDCMQRHLYKHSQLPIYTGFLQDTYVTLIDKTDPRAPSKHEVYWIHTLKIKAPMGLNVKRWLVSSILYCYCTVISFPGFGRLVLGRLLVYSDCCYIYFILPLETVFLLFWLLRWSFLWQWWTIWIWWLVPWIALS